MYDDIQIHPEGLIGLIIRDGASGEILARLHWDQSLFVGRDELCGDFLYANADESGAMTLHGNTGTCGWMIEYGIETDVAVLPPIIDENSDVDADEEQTDAPVDGFGIYNGWVVRPAASCAEPEDMTDKFETVCIHPSGPAKLVITQCSDDRDDRFTTIMEVWWDGANGQWVGTDDTFWYTWVTEQDDDGHTIDNRFLITATDDDDCSFNIELWRGDDAYTRGWKAAIITLALLLLGVLAIAAFMVLGGGGSGASSGDYAAFG